MLRSSTAAIAALFTLSGHAQSNDLFAFTLEEVGNPGNMLTVGGSNLPDLLVDFADQQNAFAPFDGVAFDASVTYGGIDDALSVTYDPAGGGSGGGLLTINSLLGSNETFVFDEADGDLGEQLEDFFLRDNPDTIESFLAAAAQQSFVAVTDGNPLASTARSARFSFMRFGLFADTTPTDRELNRVYADPFGPGRDEPGEPVEPAPDPAFDPSLDDGASPSLFQSTGGTTFRDYGGIRTRLNFRGQVFEADGFEGSAFDLALGTEVRFHDRFSAVLSVPLGYHEVEGADIFNGGLSLGLPIRVVLPDEDDTVGVKWQVTPIAAADTVVSVDFAAGGILYSYGINNLVEFVVGSVSIAGVAQYTVHESLTLSVDEYEFNPGVEQQILKLGGKIDWDIGDNFSVYGGGAWTDLLEDAAVDHYTTALAGASLRASNGFAFVVGYEGDFGDEFEAHGGSASIQLPF